MDKQEIRNIIVIGASAGGISAVSKLLSTLPHDIDAAIFIVIHLSRDANPLTVLSILNRHSNVSVQIPENNTPIAKGKAYLAPIDAHMVITKGTISITKGAKENYWRPAIDVLFRTAAAAYDSCVTGIILTGLLDDGTSGMIAIKEAGGKCIVQEPDEAEFADMPTSVINNIDVDYRVPLVDMGFILSDIYTREACEPSSVSEKLKKESEITIRMVSGYEQTSELGEATALTCPDCGGVLTKIEEQANIRYRCFTGHSFTDHVLQQKYIEKTEETLWVAIRMMEERRNFILTNRLKLEQPVSLAQDQTRRASELKDHIERLKGMLELVSKPIE